MRIARPRWALAVAAAAAAAEASVLLLRPRNGIIDAVDAEASAYFSREEIERGRSYGRPQLAIGAAAGLVQAAILVALTRRPPAIARPGELRPPAECAAAAVALTSALELAVLPLTALVHRRAVRAGLATQSWRGWALDRAKAAAISAPLTAGGGAAAVALMRRHPRGWWLPGAGLMVGGGVFLLFVGPVLLDPIFNRFTPLPDGDTRTDLLALSEAAAVDVRGVYEVDASRRTTAANAYVTGIGASRRIVLYDTLLENFTRDETRLVVAHELAHVRHRDVARTLAGLGLTAPAALRAAALLTQRLDPGEQPGAQTLAPLMLSLGAVWGLVGLISNQLSRAVERRADSFALRLTGAPRALIAFERAIALRNLADPDPPRWLSALLGTHPPVVKRIGIALAYEQGAR